MAESPEAIARMRILWPMMVKLLEMPHVQNGLRIEQKVVNWDDINAVERECGLPETPCPNTDVTVRRGSKP